MIKDAQTFPPIVTKRLEEIIRTRGPRAGRDIAYKGFQGENA